MASTYYDSSGKEVVDGDIAYASDLNDINIAIDTAFQQVETDIESLGTNQSYYADLAEKWATEAEDTLVADGKYSAYHWAQKAEDYKTAASNSATAASGYATTASNAATSASGYSATASGYATAASNSASSASGYATTASNAATAAQGYAEDSADAAAAVVESFPILASGDEGKVLVVATPYSDGYTLTTKAGLDSPSFTGIPTAPTASVGTNTTQIATTAFVLDNAPEALPGVVSGVNIEGNLYGLDITTSSQVITVTKGSAMDSTGVVSLELESNDTWTVASTNNLEQYIFLVKLNNGSIDVKAYSTYAGAASDVGVNITHYRFLSWAKNNGSGVLMPYQQVGERVDWTLITNSPLVTGSVPTSYTSYNIGAIIPVTLCSSIGIKNNSSGDGLYVSLDGTTDYRYLAILRDTDIPAVATIYLKSPGTGPALIITSITLRR